MVQTINTKLIKYYEFNDIFDFKKKSINNRL